MGHVTVFYGYIEAHARYAERNRRALGVFRFDESWPLRNVFGGPFVGFDRTSYISFAGSFKGTPDEWPSFEERFEALLGTLSGHSAIVHLMHEESTAKAELHYGREDAPWDDPEAGPISPLWKCRRETSEIQGVWDYPRN